ncbi:hypothetical protein ACFL38_00370 [Candidatus Omnitrophota bacterium]
MFSSCATWGKSKEEIEEERQEIELTEKNYLLLRDDLFSQKLKKGQTSKEIKELYGEPNDIYSTASSLSALEIWTYDFPMPDNELFDSPIRLYFANGKLSTWSI